MNQKFTSKVVIGLECHVELHTKTKLFCSCPTHGNNAPNTRTCPTCLGHPGSKPVLNKKVVDYALKLCMALGCKIAPELIFSRKSYFYPDMAKNYQITQYELPLGKHGSLTISNDKKITITRVHIEEDPAALVHQGSMQSSHYVLVDYNRSGNPLVEIVTEPVFENAAEARDFMKRLITVLSYLSIFDLKEGIIKADANVSIRESGYIRAEVKNITGFKEIEKALHYEIERQKKDIEEGKKLVQETRGWDSEKGITFTMRTKETEDDYGYIIDPDLVPIEITKEWIETTKAGMPELAHDKIEKFIKKHKIKREDAEILAQEKLLAELFEKVAAEISPELAAKWLRRELVRVANYNNKELHELKIDEKSIIAMLKMVEENKITDKIGQKLMEKLVEGNFDVKKYVQQEKLEVMSDFGELERFCKEAIAENQPAVKDYLGGEEKSFNFIVGAVMKKSRGKADPGKVREILKKLIKK